LQRTYPATSVAKTGSVETRPSIGNDARLIRGTRLSDGGRLTSGRPLRRGVHGLAALALVLSSASSAGQAVAEVVVDGGRDEMRVSVENDTVGHVLEALSEKGILHYRSAKPLNKAISGSFSGSLGQVVSRILVGFDFVVGYKPKGVEIVVYGESGAKPIPSPPIEASRAQATSTVAEQAGRSISLAPRHLLPRAPSKYDMATSNLLMRR
jgi:hypothetical protein